MNLINKILGGLKKRGTDAPPPAGPTVRAVPNSKNRTRAALLLGALLVGASAGGWWWLGVRSKKPVAPKAAQAPAQATAEPQVASAPAAEQAVPTQVAMKAAKPELPDEAKSTQGELEESSPKEQEPTEAPRKEQKHGEAKAAGQRAVVADSEPRVEHEAGAEQPKPRTKAAEAAGRETQHKKAKPAPAHAPEGAPKAVATAVPDGGVEKQVKPLSAQQRAENEFVRANALLQQGNVDVALAGYEAALQLDPAYEVARQSLAALLLANKRNADAERVLQEGLKLNVKNSGFATLLAHIQLDRDAPWSALLTLQQTLPYAERNADYQAFVAGLLQRLNRHKEAVMHYQVAVQMAPGSGVWWMGLGISLQALQRNDEARLAFRRALDSQALDADLKAFVTHQLGML